MASDDKQVADLVKQLKNGVLLAKTKHNGKKYYRRFYLHEREGSITYTGSRKIFGKPRTCK
jgi:N-acetylglutamate synthase-like GNAT family acetyltransferase